jgi:hypothetical protein
VIFGGIFGLWKAFKWYYATPKIPPKITYQ